MKFRESKNEVILGIASMPQSKLNVCGCKSILKLNTGRYKNVKNRAMTEFNFAVGLSAVENCVVSPGNDKRKCRMASVTSVTIPILFN